MRSSYPPLPGADQPRRGLFVKRWGTLLQRPEAGWTAHFEDTQFVPGAIDALFRSGQAGWSVYLLGNESQVALGRQELAEWQAFEAALLEHLRSYGVAVKRNYACLDHPDGKQPYAKDSVFLLPNTGAMYHAGQVDGITLPGSWVIGDDSPELVAGWRAGCNVASVRTGLALPAGELHVDPQITGEDLVAVLREVTADTSLHVRR